MNKVKVYHHVISIFFGNEQVRFIIKQIGPIFNFKIDIWLIDLLCLGHVDLNVFLNIKVDDLELQIYFAWFG